MFEFIPRTQAANMFICKNIIHVVYFANIGTHENGGVWSESKKYQIHSQPVFVLSLKSEKILVEAKVLSAPGGGGALNKVLHGEAPPRGPTPHPLCIIFDRKGTPFVYLPLKNGTPYTYLLRNTASLSEPLERSLLVVSHVAFNKLK